MNIGLSSLGSSISSLFNRSDTSKTTENKSIDVNERAQIQAQSLMLNRNDLSSYLNIKDTTEFSSADIIQKTNIKLRSALSKMKSTNGMSAIDKYKYMMEQAKDSIKVDTTEPDAEKLLSNSEKVIQDALSQGISSSDVVNLNRALTAKQIALSRLDMLG